MQFELLNDSVYDLNTVYAFKNKTSGLFVGYDGYDTDFSKGISDFLREDQLIDEFNKKLITKTEEEMSSLLTQRSMFDKEWNTLGGFDNLHIVKLDIEFNGKVFEPMDLLHCMTVEAVAKLVQYDDEDGTG